MKAPKGLGPAGRSLWKRILDDLGEDLELDARELRLLHDAARQADAIAALEAAIKRDGYTVKGSSGQPRLHPAVAEIRQGRLALARLLGLISLTESTAPAGTAAGARGQHAAQARWRRRDALREVKEAAGGA